MHQPPKHCALREETDSSDSESELSVLTAGSDASTAVVSDLDAASDEEEMEMNDPGTLGDPTLLSNDGVEMDEFIVTPHSSSPSKISESPEARRPSHESGPQIAEAAPQKTLLRTSASGVRTRVDVTIKEKVRVAKW